MIGKKQIKVAAVPCGQNCRDKRVESNVESGVVMAFVIINDVRSIVTVWVHLFIQRWIQ